MIFRGFGAIMLHVRQRGSHGSHQGHFTFLAVLSSSRNCFCSSVVNCAYNMVCLLFEEIDHHFYFLEKFKFFSNIYLNKMSAINIKSQRKMSK